MWFRAALVTILQHVISNRRRQVRRSLIVDVDNLEERIAETVPYVPPPAEDLTDEEVLSAVAKLPLPFQQVIVLCDVEQANRRGAVHSPCGRIRRVVSQRSAASTEYRSWHFAAAVD
jgi:hypothetical protein